MTDPIGTAQERGRPLPHVVTPSPLCHGKPPVGLDDVIGNGGLGGPKQSVTLRQWLAGDSRMPQFRARQMALQLIEQQDRALQSRIAEVGRLEERVRELEAGMQCECGGKLLMAHNHPCPTYAAALSLQRRV